MRQWREDVDRFLGMAHSGSARPRPRSFRRQHEASKSVRSPSVRGARTDDQRAELNRRRAGEDARISQEKVDDLRAELNRRRAGEDARVSLERARERRQNFEGRNLDQDFAPISPQTPRDARIQTVVPLVCVGCAALANHLRAATWPPKFRPHLLEKYDGTSNPSEFLQVYVTAITSAGGNTTVMASYFHVALTGPARTWLMNLTPGSVYCWEELCARFTANFASAYQQHGMEAHLHAVRHELRETLRAFISHFTKVRGTIPRISDASIITAFRQGCVIRRCWRNWRHMTWKPSPRSSLWPTNVQKLLRVMHGTRRRKLELPRWAAQVPPPRAVARRRRITAVTIGRNLVLQSLQLRLGAGTIATSAHGNRKVTVGHALSIPTVATAPWNAGRSRSSRNASASGASRPPRMARRLIVDLARRRSTKAIWLRENGTSGIRLPSKFSKKSSLETPTPVMTTTAARSYTLCMADAGSSPPIGT
jgi:hypothetical protein